MDVEADPAVEQDLQVTAEVDLYGILNGSITVQPGAELRVLGIVLKDVTVLAGGQAGIYGAVQGALRCRGGSVDMVGSHEGPIVVEDNGVVMFATGARWFIGDDGWAMGPTGEWVPYGAGADIDPSTPRWRVYGDQPST